MDDMKAMIRKEIHSIGKLEDRIVFKELMERVFLPLYETNTRMYHSLENRVMDDLAYDINRYSIRTGIIEREFLDPSNQMLNAVCPEDEVPQETYTIETIRENLSETGKYLIGTIFIQCDTLQLKELVNSDRCYDGIIKTDREYSIQIKLQFSKKYLMQIEHLYRLFVKNGIPWQTVNAPYFFKMIDVFATGISEEAGDEECITDFKVDLGEYNSAVNYYMIPVWNVRRLTLKSFGFPIPCEDRKNYEHVINLNKYNTENSFLVDEEEQILHVRQNGDSLVLTETISEPKKWKVRMIVVDREDSFSDYTLPMMENLRKDGFSERYQRKTGRKIRTKAELERYILGFGLNEYLEFQGYKILERGNRKSLKETYSMNYFIDDEIRIQTEQMELLLYFKGKGKFEWLYRDFASFITSELQEIYPEFNCGGIMI